MNDSQQSKPQTTLDVVPPYFWLGQAAESLGLTIYNNTICINASGFQIRDNIIYTGRGLENHERTGL